MKKNFDLTSLRPLALLTQLGISMLTPVICCMLFALWLQKRFAIHDIWLIIALLLGIYWGGYSVYQLLLPSIKKPPKRKE